MHLHPFTLAETETYLHRRGVTLDRYDVVQTYMLTGGVAYYLSYFQPGLSLAENIDAIYFAENGFLQTEYDRLFTSGTGGIFRGCPHQGANRISS